MAIYTSAQQGSSIAKKKSLQLLADSFLTCKFFLFILLLPFQEFQEFQELQLPEFPEFLQP